MRALTIALCLLATPALADVTGTASVIDGDIIEVHGQRWQCGRDAANALADKIAHRPLFGQARL